jgi:malate dehydrogenase
MTKIGFIGAGRIGSTSAFACLHMIDIESIALVDVVKELAEGEAMDLSTSAVAIDKNVKIVGGNDYGLIKNSDIVAISAGMARKPGMTRLDLTSTNVSIIKDIVKNVIEYAPNSLILMITNPLDLLTYVAYKESGKRRGEVFGMGSIHDTMRLKEQLLLSGAKKVKAYVLGEHGDSMVVTKSISKIDNGDVDWDSIEQKTRERGMEIIKRKGATFYAPANCVARMIKAVLEDTNEEFPTSVTLNGEYGITDVALGVPAILGKDGVEEIVEYELTQDELERLKISASILRERLDEIGY